MCGSCGASQKKGRRKSAHLSSAGKKSFFKYDETKSKEAQRRTKRSGVKSIHIAAERAIQVMVEARQHQDGSE